MDRVNLGSVIDQAITRVTRNRIGKKPPVFVTRSPALSDVPWKDASLRKFLQYLLYESLLTSDAHAAVEIALRRRSSLKDLTAFVGIQPSYWIQLRISGRGLKVAERFIEDLFAEVGYRCEEWVGADGSNARLGIFGAIDPPKLKMVFCLELLRQTQKWDLLLPVHAPRPAPSQAKRRGRHRVRNRHFTAVTFNLNKDALTYL